jgi:hypothetical protein
MSQTIQDAELYLNNIDDVFAEQGDRQSDKRSQIRQASSFHSLERVNAARTLRLCVAPILVDEPSLLAADASRQDTMESREASASIIFNLALAEHCLCASSSQAIAMYELASTLVDTSLPTRLVLFVLNNVAVYLYENNEIDFARAFICCLSQLLDDDVRAVTLTELRSMEANVGALSPYFASPAA